MSQIANSTSLIWTQSGTITTATIAPGAVANSQMVNMAPATIKGAVVSGPPVDLTGAQAAALLPAHQGIPSAASAATTTIDPSVAYLRTAGYSAAGDGGGGLYARVSVAPAHSAYFTTADGAIWSLTTTSGFVDARQLGAKGNGVADDTTALNNTGVYARVTHSSVRIAPSSAYYLISGTVDLTDIYVIDGRGAILSGTLSAVNAVQIGGKTLGNAMFKAWIYLDVSNLPDKTTTAATVGIAIYPLSDSRLWLGARGFYDGIKFNAPLGTEAWTGNEINVIRLYNNNNHITVNLTGASYTVRNVFRGGKYYLGTGNRVTGTGTVNITTSGTAECSSMVIEDAEIGIDGGSIANGNAALVYGAWGSSSNLHNVRFDRCRLEFYNSITTTVYGVNIATQTGNGSVTANLIDLSDNGGLTLPHFAAGYTNIDLRVISNPALGGEPGIAMMHIQPPLKGFQGSDYIYVPDRVLYDADYINPAYRIARAAHGRAVGDGDIIISGSTNAIGDFYGKRYTGTMSHAQIFGKPKYIVIVCYDSAGNVLSGAAPYYAYGANITAATAGGVGCYRMYGTSWFWIHPSVDHFFIGEGSFNNAIVANGINFWVTAGSELDLQYGLKSSPSFNGTSTFQCTQPIGTGVYYQGTDVNYRSDYVLLTTLSVTAAAAATTVSLTNTGALLNGDFIQIELDASFTTDLGTRQDWFATNFSTASTFTLAAALPSIASAGRKVRICRWLAAP